METKEELMGRILAADAEQNGLLKEDAVERLGVDAAQDYINELEAQVKLLSRSKAKLIERLDEYQGENGPYILFKDMLLRALDDYNVMDTIKDEVLDGQPDVDELSDRLDSVEYELEQQDDYHTIDLVLDSTTFESRVEDIVIDKLNEVKFKLTVEGT